MPTVPARQLLKHPRCQTQSAQTDHRICCLVFGLSAIAPVSQERATPHVSRSTWVSSARLDLDSLPLRVAAEISANAN
jgi:hypothetical protein